MKAQFFIIGSVIMVYTLTMMIRYIYGFTYIDLTQLEEMGELYYIKFIKESLINSVNSSFVSRDCNKLEADLNNTISFLKGKMIERGISLEVNYNILSCPPPEIYFNFSLRTSNLYTLTEFKYQ